METKFAVDLRYLLDQQPPDQREMIEKLVANPGFGEESYSYIYEQCSILDVSVAKYLIEHDGTGAASVFVNISKFDEAYHAEIAGYLKAEIIRDKAYRYFHSAFFAYVGLEHQKFIDFMSAHGYDEYTIQCLSHLYNLNLPTLKKFIAISVATVLKYKNSFQDCSDDEIAIALIESGHKEDLHRNIGMFSNLSSQVFESLYFANEDTESQGIQSLGLPDFERDIRSFVDNDAIAEIIINQGSAVWFLGRIEIFNITDFDRISKALGRSDYIMEIIEELRHGLKMIPDSRRISLSKIKLPNIVGLAATIVGNRLNAAIVKILEDKLGEISDEQYKFLSTVEVRNNGKRFAKNLFDTVGIAIISAISNEIVIKNPLSDFNFLERSPYLFVPDYLKTCLDIFGENADADILYLVKELLLDHEVPETFREFGVDKTGTEGIDQLTNLTHTFYERIFRGEIPQDILTNDAAMKLFLPAVRTKTTYGNTSDYQVRRSLNAITVVSQYPVGEIEVVKVDRDIKKIDANGEFIKPDKLELSQEAEESYVRTIREVQVASELLTKDGKALDVEKANEFFLEIERIAQQKIGTLRANLKDTDPSRTKSLDSLNSKIEQLEKMTTQSLWRLGKFYENIQVLSQHKEFKQHLRSLLIASTLLQNPNIDITDIINTRSKSITDLNQITRLTALLEQTVREETWKDNFIANLNEKSLKKITEVGFLSDFIRSQIKLQEKARLLATDPDAVEVRKQNYSLIPVHGPLKELSGQIADTCWATYDGHKFDGFDNFTAVLIVKDLNVPAKRRFAGAALLIEGEALDGTPLLIIRGLNPLESDTHSVDIDSFVSEFSSYANRIAQEQGRKLAIVIDGHSGGSATNRPLLYAYLSALRKSLTQVEVADTPGNRTTFNGYDITQNTYLVSEPVSTVQAMGSVNKTPAITPEL